MTTRRREHWLKMKEEDFLLRLCESELEWAFLVMLIVIMSPFIVALTFGIESMHMIGVVGITWLFVPFITLGLIEKMRRYEDKKWWEHIAKMRGEGSR